jgi:thioredoxin
MDKYSKLLILTPLFFIVLIMGCISAKPAISTNDGISSNAGLNIENKTVVLEFYADWCGYCKALEPTINSLEKEGIEVIKIDTDANPDLANQYGVRALPTIIYVKDGKVVDKTIGYNPEEIKEKAKNLYNQ